ncbi:MAG: ACT domain-containing protein [Pseudomonadota bacterium]
MDLAALLASMDPVLAPESYVFVTTKTPPDIPARMRFEEAEGTTLILTRQAAEAAGLPHEFPCRMITLNVHSALEAVGFIAHIATRLAAEGMGVNPVAGFYHDHLFIPEDRAEDAMVVLREIKAETSAA